LLNNSTKEYSRRASKDSARYLIMLNGLSLFNFVMGNMVELPASYINDHF
jgi:hypothetical protein